MTTVEQIIQACMPAVGLPKDPIRTDIRDIALDAYNLEGEKMWQAWPWDNSKIDEFSAPAPVSGVITFDATVDIIRAIRATSSADFTSGSSIFNEDEVLTAIQGNQVASDTFQNLADTSAGLRRILVNPSNSSDVYRVLAIRKWVPAIVDANYDSTNPTATPTDYRVMYFPLERATGAIMEFIKDALRDFAGVERAGRGPDALRIALQRERIQAQREIRVVPRRSMFEPDAV